MKFKPLKLFGKTVLLLAIAAGVIVTTLTGCLEDADFKSKPFASQDGSCQNTNVVPFPLPKIAK